MLEKYKMSGLKIRSVPHCLDVSLPYVTLDSFACGDPIGWCEDIELGKYSREDEHLIGLRIFNKVYGECWGHALKQHLPKIFGEF